MTKEKWEMIRSVGKSPSPRCLSSCCAVGNKIYVFGGYQVHTDGPHTVFNGMYIFDTDEQKWEHLECSGLSPDPRAATCMVHYKDHLWIFGGSQGKQIFFGDLFKFDLKKNEWTSQETFGSRDKPQRLCCHSGVLVSNRLYIFGGLTADEDYKSQRVSNDLYSIDLDMFTWRKELQSGSIPHARCCHSSIAIQNLIFVAGGGDLLSRSKYDNHVYMCNTAQGNKWTRLTSYFGNYMPKAVGLISAYDEVHHKILFFGGKGQDGEMLSGLYELPLNKNTEIMYEIRNQELQEKKFQKLFKDISKNKKQAKDDAMLQERDKLEIRSKHLRTRSNSIHPIIKIRNLKIDTSAESEDLLRGTSSESPAQQAAIPDMIRFDSVGTPKKAFDKAQALNDVAPVSPEYSGYSFPPPKQTAQTFRRRSSIQSRK